MFDASQPPTPKPQSKGFFLVSEAESSIEEEAPNDYSSPLYNKERKDLVGDELILKVTIKSCDNLISADWNGYSDPYVDKVTKSSTQLLPEESSQISSNLSVVQNNNLSVSDKHPNRSVSFFNNAKKTKSTSNMNSSHAILKSEETNMLPTVESSLSLHHKQDDVIDEQIKSEMQTDTPLPVKWNQIGKFTKTSIIFKNLNPRWGDTGEELILFIDKSIFENVMSQRNDSNRTKLFLRLDAFDYDKYTRDDVLGHCIIDLEVEDMYSFLNGSSKSMTKSLVGVKHGSINFDISLMEDPAIFNAELSHILQRRREKGNQVPKSIDILFDYVLENCCDIEGVLRIPGNRAHILRIKKKMDEMVSLPIGTFIEAFIPEETTNEFPHTAVGVLKEYLRVMPTPIIQFELYDECVGLIESKELCTQKLEQVMRKVERSHLPLFYKTMLFMKKIADQSAVNRMTPKNVGIVMGPNILRRKGQSADSALRHVNHITSFVEFLINSHTEVIKVLDQIMFEGMDQAGKFEKIMDTLDIVTVEEEEDLQSEEDQLPTHEQDTATITDIDNNCVLSSVIEKLIEPNTTVDSALVVTVTSQHIETHKMSE